MAAIDEHFPTITEASARFGIAKPELEALVDDGHVKTVAPDGVRRVVASSAVAYIRRKEGDTELAYDERSRAPRDASELRARIAEFDKAAHRDPESFVAAWRDGELEDTLENARLLSEALILRTARREALQLA